MCGVDQFRLQTAEFVLRCAAPPLTMEQMQRMIQEKREEQERFRSLFRR